MGRGINKHGWTVGPICEDYFDSIDSSDRQLLSDIPMLIYVYALYCSLKTVRKVSVEFVTSLKSFKTLIVHQWVGGMIS